MTFAGKVNRLAIMVRGNLGAALQGFVALPLLVGYDLDDPDRGAAGRIVSFDAAGGWHIEDEGYQAVGSGSLFAKASMKKLYPTVGGCRFGAEGGRRGPLRRRRRRFRHRRTRPGSRYLPDGGHHRGRRRPRGARGANRPARPSGHRNPFAHRRVRAGQGTEQPGAEGRLMSFPYFISPEQAMRERSELARKGIARGRSVVTHGLRRRCAVRRRESVTLAAEGQ